MMRFLFNIDKLFQQKPKCISINFFLGSRSTTSHEKIFCKLTSFISKAICGVAMTSVLTSCAPSAKLLAEKHNFVSQKVKGGQFLLQSYQRITNSSLSYVIYIEGDGLAFK